MAQEKKIDGIVFYKWDRLARSVLLAEALKSFFKKHNVELIPSDDSAEPLSSSIMQIMGEQEIRNMKGRVREARKERFNQGLPVGRTPYGYSPIKKNKKVVGYKIDKKIGKIVQDCFKMTLEGFPYSKICKKHKINPQTYYNIIRNKVYKGIITFEGEEKEGNFEPIVNEEMWEKANRKLNQ